MAAHIRTAFVTGASTGIGRAIALALAKNKVRVVCIGRDESALRTVVAEIISNSGQADFRLLDLRSLECITAVTKELLNVFGIPDILIHAAGVWHDDQVAYAGVPLADTPAEQVDEVLDVNLRAPFHLTRALLPSMISASSGKILAISGTFASGGAGWLHYFVSKSALEYFIIGLAAELRSSNIQANCISPSDTATPALEKYFPEDAKTALSPSEVAQLAVFLCSDEADNITGQSIVIKSKHS